MKPSSRGKPAIAKSASSIQQENSRFINQTLGLAIAIASGWLAFYLVYHSLRQCAIDSLSALFSASVVSTLCIGAVKSSLAKISHEQRP
jgi:hypothetical protein